MEEEFRYPESAETGEIGVAPLGLESIEFAWKRSGQGRVQIDMNAT